MIFLTQQSDQRVLAVYTINAGNALYKQQMALLNADKAGLAERDLVIQSHVLNKQNEALFKKNHIKGDFAIILIGKDGGEKLRGTQPVSTQKLYAVIDAMPMRKDEMKRKDKQ